MKAILVIDIPYGLSLSDLYISGGLWEAGQDDGWAYEFKAEDIKPMPTKKLAVFDANCCDIEEEIKIIHEIEGYNRCIDEILGEEIRDDDN